MLRLFFSLLAVFFFSSVQVFAGITWSADMESATRQAAEQKKDLFIVYKGKGWNPDALGRPEKSLTLEPFLSFAKDKYIFVALEYPEELKKKTEEQGEGDSLVVFSREGQLYYAFSRELKNGPDWLVEEIKFAEKNRTRIEVIVKNIQTQSGEEKNKAIKRLYEVSSQELMDVSPQYRDWVKECLEQKGEAAEGLKVLVKERENEEGTMEEAVLSAQAYANRLMNSRILTDKQKSDQIKKYWDELVNEKGMTPAGKQHMAWLALMYKIPQLQRNAQTENMFFTLIAAELSGVISIDPESKYAALLKKYGTELLILPHITGAVNNLKRTDPVNAVTLLDEFLKKYRLTASSAQILTMMKGITEIINGEIETGIDSLKKARDLAPWTGNALHIGSSIDQLEAERDFLKKIVADRKEGKPPTVEGNRKWQGLLSVKIDPAVIF